MMTHISNALINELLSRTDIVALINSRVPLKKQGKNFLACCPFHSEIHPSFTVNKLKQFYYCFSCGAHGNAINFLMNHDHLTFLETIKELSIIHGISYVQNCYIQHNEHYQKKIYQLMSYISVYYQNILTKKQYLYAYQYLQNRGLTDETINNFNIGFAPPGWNNLIRHCQLQSYDQKLLHQSGMIICNTKYKYDRFRERLMFPIRDKLGRIIAFGGRVIHEKNIPKYLNSPDTEIFKKNQYLYGFYEAQKKNKKIPHIILVEGYIDVITLTQFGIDYVVASLGTAITINHIQLMYSITDQIICCYDGDYAGQNAAWRILNTVLPYLTDNRQIRFMFLPNGEDPDTLIRKIGKDNFLKQLTQTQDLSYFLFKKLSQKINLKTLNGRVKLSSLVLPMLNKIPGKILRLCLRQQLGNKIGILDENKLNQLLTTKPKTYVNVAHKYFITYSTEHVLIGLLIQNPKLVRLIPTIQGLEKWHNKKIIIFIDLVKTCMNNPTITSIQLLEYYQKNKFFEKLETLAYWNHMIKDDMIETVFINTLIKLYNMILEQYQNILIARDRASGLTVTERQKLWFLNKKLSIH